METKKLPEVGAVGNDGRLTETIGLNTSSPVNFLHSLGNMLPLLYKRVEEHFLQNPHAIVTVRCGSISEHYFSPKGVIHDYSTKKSFGENSVMSFAAHIIGHKNSHPQAPMERLELWVKEK